MQSTSYKILQNRARFWQNQIPKIAPWGFPVVIGGLSASKFSLHFHERCLIGAWLFYPALTEDYKYELGLPSNSKLGKFSPVKYELTELGTTPTKA